jgi:hypothetical protein
MADEPHFKFVFKINNAYRIVVRKPEGKRPLRRSKLRQEDNIKIVLREIGWAGMDWIRLAQNVKQWRTVVNTVMNLRFPLKVGKSSSS